MKKGMCTGCDNLTERIQIQFFKEDGLTRNDPPVRVMKPFCEGDPRKNGYGLHLEYIDRIVTGNEVCPRYRNGGIT